MKKRILSIFLALVLILTALAGCNKPSDAESTGSPGAEAEDSVEPTAEEPVESEGANGEEATSTPEPEPDYVELPVGCYAGYDGSVIGYLKVTDNTMIFYYPNGDIEGEANYSYDSDGSCILEIFDTVITVQFTYEQDSYYMNREGESRRLEPISESEIPEYNTPSDMEAYFIGANGSVALYVWLPEVLYENLNVNNDKGSFSAQAECYNYGVDTHLMFAAAAASGNALQEGIDEAKAGYDGIYSSDADLLFNYLRESFIEAALDNDYSGDIFDGYETINGREWRYCQTYSEESGLALAMLFWMQGDDMVLMAVGGTVESSGSYENMTDTLRNVISSLRFDA